MISTFNMFVFEVLFHFFVKLTKIIGNKLNNSLLICVEKRYRMKGKPKNIDFIEPAIVPRMY